MVETKRPPRSPLGPSARSGLPVWRPTRAKSDCETKNINCSVFFILTLKKEKKCIKTKNKFFQ